MLNRLTDLHLCSSFNVELGNHLSEASAVLFVGKCQKFTCHVNTDTQDKPLPTVVKKSQFYLRYLMIIAILH